MSSTSTVDMYDITGAQKGGVTNPMMHGATESSGDLTPEQTHSFTWGEEDHASHCFMQEIVNTRSDD